MPKSHEPDDEQAGDPAAPIDRLAGIVTGADLRDARLVRGMSQAELATRSELSRRTVIRIEQGAPAASATMTRLRRALQAGEGRRVGDSIGGRLRELREAAGTSIDALSYCLQVSNATISRIERGHCEPRGGWNNLLSNDYAIMLKVGDESELCRQVGVDCSAI